MQMLKKPHPDVFFWLWVPKGAWPARGGMPGQAHWLKGEDLQNTLGIQEWKISRQEALVIVWSEGELFSRPVHANRSLFFYLFILVLTPILEFKKHKPFLWHCVIFCHIPMTLVFEEVTDTLLTCQQYPQRICEYHRVLRINSSLNLHVSVVSYSLVHTQGAHHIWMADYLYSDGRCR